MSARQRRWLVSFTLSMLLASLVLPVQADDWWVGKIVGLCKGTHIYYGPDESYGYHTIVPEDDWAVKIIGGPRGDWWDTSRREAGDPSSIRLGETIWRVGYRSLLAANLPAQRTARSFILPGACAHRRPDEGNILLHPLGSSSTLSRLSHGIPGNRQPLDLHPQTTVILEDDRYSRVNAGGTLTLSVHWRLASLLCTCLVVQCSHMRGTCESAAPAGGLLMEGAAFLAKQMVIK